MPHQCAVALQGHCHAPWASHIDPDVCLVVAVTQMHHHVGVGVAGRTDALVRHKILLEALFFAGHQPRKIWLVVGERSTHQLDVGAIFVGQLPIPHQPKIAVAPGPLLFAGHQMMVGHVHHAGLLAMIIVADKVVVRMVGHVRRRHRDVFVARNVRPRRIVHFVVRAFCNGELTDVAFAVVHHRMHIRREHRLVVVVYVHSRIGPPEERLRLGGAVVQLRRYLQYGFVGVHRKAVQPFGEEHPLDFATPDRRTPVGVLDDAPIDRVKGARPMMLRPVELDPARDPWPTQPNQGWFNDAVVIDEVVPVCFVERHLDATAQLGQNHHFEVGVLEVHRGVCLVVFVVRHTIDHGVWIDHPATALIDPLIQKLRLLQCRPDPVGGDDDRLAPGAHTLAHAITPSWCKTN